MNVFLPSMRRASNLFAVLFLLLVTVTFFVPVATLAAETIQSTDKAVLHDGELMNERVAILLDSNHSSFFSGLVAPCRAVFHWVASGLATRPVGYGESLGTFLDATWGRGQFFYCVGFVVGVLILLFLVFVLYPVGGHAPAPDEAGN